MKNLLKIGLAVYLLIANASMLGMQATVPVAAPVPPINDPPAELLNLRHEQERLSKELRMTRNKRVFPIKVGLLALSLLNLIKGGRLQMPCVLRADFFWSLGLGLVVAMFFPMRGQHWLLNHCIVNWFPNI